MWLRPRWGLLNALYYDGAARRRLAATCGDVRALRCVASRRRILREHGFTPLSLRDESTCAKQRTTNETDAKSNVIIGSGLFGDDGAFKRTKPFTQETR